MAGLAPSLVPVFLGDVLGTVTMLFLAVYTLRERESDATLRSFAALALAIALWAWADAGRLLATTAQAKLVFHYLGYVGVVTAPVAWLHFAVLYTGRGHRVSWRTVAGLSVVPAGILALVVTNPQNLFYRSVEIIQVGETPVLALDAGPLFWPAVSYNYLLIVAGITLLVGFAATTDTLYRLQSVSITTAVIFPFLLNVLFLSGYSVGPGVDPTPIGFALSGLLIAVAVFYGDFVHLLPVAKDTIVETIDDGILVVDDSDTVAHANPAAQSLLVAGPDDKIVGRNVDAVLPWNIEDSNPTAAGTEVSVDTEDGWEWYWFRQVELDAKQATTGDVYIFTDITRRKELERRLRALQETHQRLMTTETVDEVGEIVIDAARDVLDLPVTGLWQHDPDAAELVPVQITTEAEEIIEQAPVFEPGNSLAWETFQTGRLRVFSDVTHHPDAYDDESPINAEVQVPVGDRGIIVTGSERDREFDDVTLELVRILAAATERAFVRTEREVELRRREAQLTRENERLDEFTSVVAHDLRSPLNSADILLERLTDEYDDQRLEKVASAQNRTRELVDDLLALARQGETVKATESVALDTVTERAWGSLSTGEATLDLAVDGERVRADVSRLRQVFENLFRNAVEHAGDEAAVRVEALADEDGFYVADDGPGIPPDERADVFDHGYTRSGGGTGFGLAIVRRIVEAHGWTVRATDSADGGLRVEVLTGGPEQSAPDHGANGDGRHPDGDLNTGETRRAEE